MATIRLLLLLGITATAILKTNACECQDKDLGCFDRVGVFKSMWGPWCLDEVKAKYGLYTRGNKEVPQYITRTSLIPKEFDPQKRTMVLIHGFRNTFSSQWLHDIRKALLEKEDCNVIILGWGGGANHHAVKYRYSASTTRLVGAELSFIINRLKKEKKLADDKVWCIGHSLGAHVCGYAGARTRIGRITGLDPADPRFSGEDTARRLDPSDAGFVDIIHTDAGRLGAGMAEAVGHADFYPNGIGMQPGCGLFGLGRSLHHSKETDETTDHILRKRGKPGCSHSRAYKYFVESIKGDGCFKVRQKCYPDQNGKPSRCADCATGECGEMGYGADPRFTGMFKLSTTKTAPYCQQ